MMTLIDTSALASTNQIVHLHQGNPVTNSLAIAGEFLRSHKNVLQSLDSLIADGTISRLDFKPRDYKDERGKSQRMIELTERGALIAMPFIGGRNSRTGQVRLVTAFMAMRDELREHHGTWSDARSKVATRYQMMSDALQEARADAGKSTAAYHYANEAKLVNWVLFGRFEAVSRETLGQAELVLLDKVEARNAIWIARGRSYEERKASLPAYANGLRGVTPLIEKKSEARA
jgi:Rha family phage regulatory protein